MGALQNEQLGSNQSDVDSLFLVSSSSMGRPDYNHINIRQKPTLRITRPLEARVLYVG